MSNKSIVSTRQLLSFVLAIAAGFATGCIRVKDPQKTPALLKTEKATLSELTAEVNRFAKVNSMKAQMDLKLEDNSFAQFGSKEVYRAADGEVVVQRPASILLTVKIPVIKSDVAQMSSDGQKFRVALLQDGSGGKYKKFILGSNNADYSKLSQNLTETVGVDQAIKENVSAFANIRPQHFTDAMLVRPIDEQFVYTQTTIFQDEENPVVDKKSPLRKVTRGYYLLDEYAKSDNGDLRVLRRFWFDRIGGIRLARQQLFDSKGEINSDIVYGVEGNLSDSSEYARLPLQIIVTRPQEKYAMKLTYQMPDQVKIGRTYPASAFVLQNTWGLQEVDLDKKLQEVTSQNSLPPGVGSNTSTRAQ